MEITSRETRIVRTVISIKDYDRALAVGFNAVECSGGHDVHPSRIDGDELAIHDHFRLAASDEQSFRIVVSLRRVRFAIELQELEFSRSNFLHFMISISTTNERGEN